MMNEHLDPIEQRIKRYYEKQSLPLDTLLDLEKRVEVSKVKINPKWQWVSIRMNPVANFTAIAAILLVCIGLTTYLVRQEADLNKVETVAAEIALNHAKQFDSEFFTSNIPSLVHSMPLLDFAPVQPRRMQLKSYDMRGARYCTIDHSIAVQVRLVDEAETAYTLYQFRTLDSVQFDEEQIITVGDIQVTLWKEGDVTIGLAHRVNEF